MKKTQPKLEYTLIRSSRKTVALQIKDGKLLVRAPMLMPQSYIDGFVERHRGWVEKKLFEPKVRMPLLTAEEKDELLRKARDYFPKRVRYYASLMGVEYRNVTVRMQKTRWGSCSGKKNLNFNCLLMLFGSEVIDSVIVHELCHLVYMDHSREFYDLLLKYYPEYRFYHGILKKKSSEIMKRAGF